MPVESQQWVNDVMEKTYPLGVFLRPHKRASAAQLLPSPRPRSMEIPRMLGVA